MKKRNVHEIVFSRSAFGLYLCLMLFVFGFMIHGNLGLYFNVAGLLIVLGGTFGATLLNYRFERLLIVSKVLRSAYRTRMKEPEEIVGILVDLSVKSRIKGILALQDDEKEASLLFMREALGYLVDGFKKEHIRDILNSEIYYFRLRRDDCERVLRTMANYAPSFGLVGSVVGLIGMLAGVGDTETILKTVPIALTSTLYGIVLANFVFIPFAGKLRERTDRELLLQKIIMEGMIAIQSEVSPRVLERKLKSFLTPASRLGRLVSLKKIQKRFNIQSNPATYRQPAYRPRKVAQLREEEVF